MTFNLIGLNAIGKKNIGRKGRRGRLKGRGHRHGRGDSSFKKVTTWRGKVFSLKFGSEQ